MPGLAKQNSKNSWAPNVELGKNDGVASPDVVSLSSPQVKKVGDRMYHVVSDYTETRQREKDGSLSVEYRYNINYDRWKSIAAGLYLEFLAGLIYAFPVYSGRLKSSMNLSQVGLSNISTAGTIGGNFSIVAGIFLDQLGPTWTSTRGARIASLGFFLIYLCTAGLFPVDAVPVLLACFYFIAYQGLTWMDMSTVATQVTNFPHQKGLAVGLVKTQFGLAASAIVILSVGFFGGGSKLGETPWCKGTEFQSQLFNTTSSETAIETSGGITLLLFFSFLCIIIGTAASHFLKYTPPTFNNGMLGKGGLRKMYLNFGFVGLVMAYCLVVSLVKIEWYKTGEIPEGADLIFAIVQVFLYLFPFFLLLRTKRRKGQTAGVADSGEAPEDWLPKNSDAEDLVTEVPSDNEVVGATVSSMYDFSFKEALLSIEFWCLFFIFFGGTGAAYMTINQLTQINVALGGTAADKALAVVFVGLFNCLGRIVLGNIQDFTGRCGLTRPALCVFVMFLMGTGQLILADATSPQDVVVGVGFTAFAFGSTWCLIGPTTSDIVGKKAFGKIFSSVSMAAMGSTVVFNSLIAGPNYQAELSKQGENVKKTCCGPQCYESAHTTAAIVSFCVAVAPMVLWYRTRTYYKNLYAANK